MDQQKRSPPLCFQEPITDEHLIGIGRIITRWSMAERVIMDSLREIATGQSFDALEGDVSISPALVTGMDARVMLGILKAVFRARHPQDADELNRIVDKLADPGKVSEYRCAREMDRRETTGHDLSSFVRICW
jgi:hypothetical protein